MSSEGNHQNHGITFRKKRVLFAITQPEFGGAQRFLFSFAARLDRSKYDLSVAVGVGNGLLVNALKQKNIPVIQVPSLIREMSFRRDLAALRELKNIIASNEPDALFLLSSKAGFIGALAARRQRSKIRVIYRIGGWTFNDPWPAWKKFFYYILERFSAKWKDIIIVNNLRDKRQAEHLGIKPREKVELVYNGLDVYKMDFIPEADARRELANRIGISGDWLLNKTIIGTVANFYPAKGLEYFIKTAAYFRENENIVFIIIGDGIGRRKLESMITELGFAKKVFLAGQLPDASKFMPAFDVFYLASLKEGFPWALIEAMSAKLPVVATDVGAVSEIIQNGKSGFIVPPADPKTASNAIKTILESAKLGPEMGIQAHQRVLFNFSPERTLDQIEALL